MRGCAVWLLQGAVLGGFVYWGWGLGLERAGVVVQYNDQARKLFGTGFLHGLGAFAAFSLLMFALESLIKRFSDK